MYQRIDKHLALAGKTKKELAASMGISYNTLLSKLGGRSSFTLDEALLLKSLLEAEDNVEDLFTKKR